MNQPTNHEKGKEEVVIVRLRESRMRKGGINPLSANPSPPPPPPQTPAEILLKGLVIPLSHDNGGDGETKDNAMP